MRKVKKLLLVGKLLLFEFVNNLRAASGVVNTTSDGGAAGIVSFCDIS